MKSMNDSNSDDNHNNNNNWLGFSLSPHIKIGDELSSSPLHNHYQQQTHPSSASNTVPTSFYFSPSHFTNSAICYGVPENANYHSPLTVMPLKSDGSLCIMEALGRSQSQVMVSSSSSSPKLEDFLGGATMGTHDEYGSHEREAMALSLDSIYYNGQQNADPHQANRDHSLDLLSESFRQQTSSHPYYAALGYHGMFQTPLEVVESKENTNIVDVCSSQMPQNWVSSRDYSSSASQLLEQQMNNGGAAGGGGGGGDGGGSVGTVGCGGYDMEEKAARAYDQAALKYWGPSTHINFPLENYQTQLEEMKNMTRQEYVAHLRRKSSGFSRGASMYRGVTRHHQHGRWQARIGRVAGNKDLYLGTFSTQEEAAEAYDVAAIKFRGSNAVTNFDISKYDVERIMASNTLLSGEHARRIKDNVVARTDVIEYNNDTNVSSQNNGEAAQVRNNENDSKWKMVSNNCDRKNDVNSGGSYKNSDFSMSLQDLVSGQQHVLDDSNKIGTHFSNPSSLVTSLSSSREASPDHKTGPSLLFPKLSMESKIATNGVGVSSWFPSQVTNQMRPTSSINLSHFPVFAAWNDA
ncbi:hypothetical protein TSUD_315730 [Trifolium subterraneum]|uniref:AP2/ERF domain-containing protein n=1 Tax=Trifolium subterraneum TaxID=3900 RepID=A0A2Z6NHI0_TRISU|nr:hypothetical protein TSUD_315730 [Trifolium subterraneum]